MADEVPNVTVIGVDTKEELDAYVKELRDTAEARKKDVTWNQRKEKLHEFMFRACAVTSRVSLVLGIALLLSFAILNINPPSKGADSNEGSATPASAPGGWPRLHSEKRLWVAHLSRPTRDPCRVPLPAVFRVRTLIFLRLCQVSMV